MRRMASPFYRAVLHKEDKSKGNLIKSSSNLSVGHKFTMYLNTWRLGWSLFVAIRKCFDLLHDD